MDNRDLCLKCPGKVVFDAKCRCRVCESCGETDYRHDCPVCGALVVLDESVVCDVCGWEYDLVQNDDHDYRGGANYQSLNEARAYYAECGKSMTPEAEAEKSAYYEAKYGKRTVPWEQGVRDHSKQFPGLNQKQYARRALELARMAAKGDVLGFMDKDGAIVRYDKAANDYVVAYAIAGVATMFRPDDGEGYFRAREKGAGSVKRREKDAGGAKAYEWECPACAYGNCGDLPQYDVCGRCGWEDDHYQHDNPDYRGGANFVSLNEARANYPVYGKSMSPENEAEETAYCDAKYGKRTAPS